MVKFDQRQWIDDIAVGTVTGLLTGALGALLVAAQAVWLAASVGGLVGAFTGVCNQPLRWLLEKRPGVNPSTPIKGAGGNDEPEQ